MYKVYCTELYNYNINRLLRFLKIYYIKLISNHKILYVRLIVSFVA